MKLILDVAAGTVTAHRPDETGHPLCGVRVARRQLVVKVEQGSIPPDWFCISCRNALVNMAEIWADMQQPMILERVEIGRGRTIFERKVL